MRAATAQLVFTSHGSSIWLPVRMVTDSPAADKTIQMAEGLGTYICVYERPQHGRLDHLLKPKSARLLCRRFGLHGETGVY